MRIFILTLVVTVLAISSNASELSQKKVEDIFSSYIAIDKLNKNIYSTENQDIILGLGVSIKSTKRLDFIIAYEGDIYNETTNNSIISSPTYKVTSYIDDGVITYKINYKF